MRIVRLQAEGFKRIVAVDITPEGDLVEVRGNNENGKSSVLDAIFAALGGAEVALRRLTTASPAWRAGLSQEYAVRVDTTTTVAIAVTPLGPP